MSGALLQSAKQAISYTYRGLTACPRGRNVGSQSIKDVIWQARNQAVHFEAGKYDPLVLKCFQQLEADFGPDFSLTSNPKQNLAERVVTLLDWKSYDDYEKDMTQLCP
jgi:hypothetical protein